MKVILQRGGDYRDQRFEPSDQPQDVPAEFGRAMVARGYAEAVQPPRARSRADEAAPGGEDE